MSYTIQNAKADLTSVLHGTTLNSLNNINGLFYRTASQILLDLDPQETKRIVPLVSPIYNQVWDYAVPVDLKGNRVIDIRPQVNRYPTDITPQAYERQFDLNKGLNASASGAQAFEVQFNSGIKTVRINRTFGPAGTTLSTASQISDNGTWSTFGDASNLTIDNVNYAANPSSLKFDLAASGSFGGLVNSTLTAIDLSTALNQSSNFLYVYLPTASVFTSVVMRFGSSATNYYEITATVSQMNTSFQNGWNLLQFTWSNVTTSGTPNASAITYIRVGYHYDGTAQAAVHLNSIVNRMGQILEMVYYSNYMFRTAGGTFQSTISDDSNVINLDIESYNIFLKQLAYLADQQVQGLDAQFFDANFFYQGYTQDIARYKALYKSEVMPPQSVYYKKPSSNYGQYYNYRNF